MSTTKTFHYLDPADTEVVHVRGSGPGGQNRNKRMSGVRVLHRPTGIVVTATERRSQAQNLAHAFERLEKKLALRFHKVKPRFKTKVPAGSKADRLDRKQTRSRVKRLRRYSAGTED